MEERNVQSRLDAIEMQVIRLARWLKLAIYGWLLTVFVLLLSAWTWEPKAAQESKAQKDVLRVHQLVVVDERSEEHTSELQSRLHLVCRLLLEKKKTKYTL